MRVRISPENSPYLVPLTHVKCGWITEVLWSPDGSSLAVAGADGVRLYVNAFGGVPRYTLQGHEGHVKSAAFSADGAMLASVGSDKVIKLWDTSRSVEDVHEIATLTGHDDSIDGVAFHPDGNLLATCSADGTIILWNIARREKIAVLDGHEREVTSVIFALNGNVVVSGSWDHTVRLWDASAETEGTIIGEHQDWVRAVSVNPSGTMIASAGKDMTVRLWDAHSGEAYGQVFAHLGGADSAVFNPDGNLLATSGRDNVIRIWSVQQIIRTGKVSVDDALVTLTGHQKPVMSLAFNPAGTLLASGSGDNTVRLWSVSEDAETPDTSRGAQTGYLSDTL